MISIAMISAPRYPDAYTLQPNERLSESDIEDLKKKQNRLAAYRALIFWTYPEIRKKERRPLPSCVYKMVRMKFSPSESDDELTNYDDVFTKYVPEAEDD